MRPTLHAIIPAGGAGTRLWPLSRQASPKFLLDPLGHGRTMLQETFDRLRPLSLSITVVTGCKHVDEVRRQLPELVGGGDAFPGEIIAEPSPRDSMAAIGLATYVIRERYGDSAVVGSFAADHVIADRSAFAEAVQRAAGAAQAGWLATIGIAPTEPSTAFGYIQPAAEPIATSVYPVSRFVEKPQAEVAGDYVEQGFLWNAGIFVSRAGTLVDGLAAQLPAMDTQLSALARRYMVGLIDTGEAQSINPDQWDRLMKIAIDYALAEPMAADGRVAVVRAPKGLGWSDVGDFQALARLYGAGAASGKRVVIDSDGSLIVAADPRKAVAVLGIPGAVVVDTEDALMVTNQAHAQQVKRVVDRLRDDGDLDLL